MLSPTDRTIFSAKPSLFNFRIDRRRKPGIKVKKIKPENCLTTGMSKRVARLVRMRNTNINKSNLLELVAISDLIMLTTRPTSWFTLVPDSREPLKISSPSLGEYIY